MENVKEEKKLNWWTRKTTGGKVAFILSAILTLISVFAFVVLMDLRTFLGNEIADMVYGEGVTNGWHRIGIAMVNSTGSWIMTAVIIFITIVFIFISNDCFTYSFSCQIHHNHRCYLFHSRRMGCRCCWHYRWCWSAHSHHRFRLSKPYPRCCLWYFYCF